MSTPVKSKCCAKLREVIKSSLLSVPAYAISPEAPPKRSFDFDAQVAGLIKKAESKGRIPVTIRLRVGFTPEGDMSSGVSGNSSVVGVLSNSANTIGAQRHAIKAAQDDVIGLLSQGIQGAASSFNSNANKLTVELTYIFRSITCLFLNSEMLVVQLMQSQ